MNFEVRDGGFHEITDWPTNIAYTGSPIDYPIKHDGKTVRYKDVIELEGDARTISVVSPN